MHPVAMDRLRPDDLDILKTIGVGTFSRVVLCSVKAKSLGRLLEPEGGTAAGPSSKRSGRYFALKILSLADVVRQKQVDHLKSEISIQSDVRHPFLLELLWHRKVADRFVYLLFPFVSGGELFSYLRTSGRFSPTTATFYAAEATSALAYLHSKSIAYRDLKPENLLLDGEGHLKMADFGFAKRLAGERDRTWTLCGTPEYLAPEVIQGKGHGPAVDWWALGVLVFEMLAGYPPYFDDNPFGIYEKILNGKVDWPKHFDPVVKDLIKKLLAQDRLKRLGSLKNGAEDVKRHRWFKGLEWDDVVQKRLRPPILPAVGHEGDTRNYDDYPDIDLKAVPPLEVDDLGLFADLLDS